MKDGIILMLIAALMATSLSAQDYHARFRSYYYDNSGYQNESYRSYLLRLSVTGSSHDFEELSYGIDALRYIFRATTDTGYLNDAIVLINNVVKRAKQSNQIRGNKFFRRSSELGWIDNNSGTYVQGQESQLYEGKFFKSVCPLVYEIYIRKGLQPVSFYQDFKDQMVDFIAKNVWRKWYNRSFTGNDTCGKFLLDGRTHMASHWATVAIYLREMADAGGDQQQYNWLIRNYDCMLRKNLKRHPLLRRTYSWNSTWDEGWRVGKDCSPIQEDDEVQDTDHANEVISYLVKAAELKSCWRKPDLEKMAKLFTRLLWIPGEKAFHGSISGNGTNKKRTYFIAEGFAKLGIFSSKATGILQRFSQTAGANYSRQGCQLMAVLYYNSKQV